MVVASYFRRVPELLESAGNRVIQTRVPPAGSIRERAEALKREIRSQVDEEPVNIIAHSMGGLDARCMIAHLGMAEQVRSLTTLGTPHRGSPVADEVTSKLALWIRRIGIPDDALHDLRVNRCHSFNLTTPDARGVRYFSVAGQRERARMTFYPLQFSHDVIFPVEGPNDGLVSVKSATWGESLTVWDCDHVNLVGWVLNPWDAALGRFFDFEKGYTEILERLESCGF